MKILGVDPGSINAGYAIVEVVGHKLFLRSHGTIKMKGSAPFSERLMTLFDSIEEVIGRFSPGIMSIEKVFFAKNPMSALKLGQARGVLLLAAEKNGLELFEYNPTEVKSAIVGNGRATKEDVAKILDFTFGRQEFDSHDASDAVSIATCHALCALHQERKNKGRNSISL